MKQLHTLILVLLFAISSFAQPLQKWAKTYNNGDVDKAVAIKNFGCYTYVTGVSYANGSGNDFLTIKYNTFGDTVWTRRYTGPVNGGDDTPVSMVVDTATGSVYVTGKSQGNATGFDYATVKYDANGVMQWNQRFNNTNTGGNGDDIPVKIILDATSTNVFVGGYSYNYVSSSSKNDFLICKYSTSTGNIVANWPASYTYNNYDDELSSMAVDNTGNLYVIGASDPTSSQPDPHIILYNSTGTQLASGSFHTGPETDIKVDGSGNIYTVGMSQNQIHNYQVYVDKYQISGGNSFIHASGWTTKYFYPNTLGISTSNNNGYTILTNQLILTSNAMYVNFDIDIDPDINTYNYDATVLKLNLQNGDTIWTKRIGGTGEDKGKSLAVDGTGNAYLTGYITNSSKDIFINKYANSNGAVTTLVGTPYNGTANSGDEGTAIYCTTQGNILVAGYTTGNTSQEDFITFKYSSANPPLASAYNGLHATTVCQGSSLILGASNPIGLTYNWSPSTWLTSSTARNPTFNYSSVLASPTSIKYNLTVTDESTCLWAFDSVTITVNPRPSVAPTSNSPICAGVALNLFSNPSGGQAPYTYSWSGPSSFSSNSQNPIRINATTAMTGIYTVTDTDANSCTASASVSVTINPNPNASITPSGSTTFCSGGSITLNVNQCNNSGYSYQWNNGTGTCIVVTQSGSYMVTVTNTSTNCSASSTATTVTVDTIPAIPVLTINGTTTFCAGGSVTLTAPTGYTYAWSNSLPSQQSNSVTSSGSYAVTITDSHNCSAASSATTVVVKQPELLSFSASICQGSSYPFKGQSLTTAGIYKDTIIGVATNGCDSIVTLNLNVQNLTSTILNASICSGNSYNFNGQSITTAGSYIDTLQSSLGCDSIEVTLNLQVSPLTSSISDSICQGGSYLFNGQSLSAAGTYIDTVQNQSGCDSIITLTLTFKTCTGIMPLLGTNFFSIQPNPVADELNINGDGILIEQVNIYNTNGQLLFAVKEPKNNRIDVSAFTNGVYIAEIKVKGVLQRVRWIKM